MTKFKIMPHSSYINLSVALAQIYAECGFIFAHFQPEPESRTYEACSFKLNELQIIHRAARITPKKTGQFVVLWKRNEAGVTVPFSISDAFDFMVISVGDKERFGQFIFPKGTLETKGIISSVKEGKRGIRLYPPWEDAVNKQAQKTQQWQSDYFLEVPIGGGTVNIEKVKKLFEHK